MSVVLAEAVDRAVAAALIEHNGQVEKLIRETLDRELARLVAAELDTLAEAEPAPPPVDDAQRLLTAEARVLTAGRPATKVCTICERELPTSKFDHGRRQCQACRSAAHRARKREPRPDAPTGRDVGSEDPPRPDTRATRIAD